MPKGIYKRKEKHKITKKFLLKQYPKKTLVQIAKEIGCSRLLITNKLRKYNISIKKGGYPKGTKFTKEHKKKIKESNIKYYREHPNIHKGTKNPRYGKKWSNTERIRISENTKIAMQRPEVKKKHLENLPDRHGKNNSQYGKITHGKSGKYKGIWMRSSWEISYAKYLDRNKIKWFYEPKVFGLGDFTYRPDFYLPRTNEYIEIKGWWRDDAKKKFRLFKQKYPKVKIKVLMQKDLQRLNVLN